MTRLLTLALLALGAPARAVPTTLTYAGVLTDADARVNGTVDVIFELFDDDTAGTVRYSEEQNGVIVVDGELIAELGNNALDDTILDLPELWLEVTVQGTPLAPRVRLNSVPYALRAEAAFRAAEAILADEALSLGGILPSDVVTNAQLQALNLASGILAGTGIDVSGGTVSIASGGVGAAQLASSAVTTSALADGAVTTAKIGAGAVGSAQLASGAVGAAQLANGAVGAGQIAAGAVGSTQLAAGAVGTLQLATSAVTSAQLAPSAVTTGAILDGAVTLAKIGANAVDSTKLVNGSVASADIGTDVIVAGNIASNAVGTLELADNAVTLAKLNGEVSLFQVEALGCVEAVNSVTTDSLCAKDTASCPAGQCRDCDANVCGAACSILVCGNRRIGTIFP